MIISDFYHSKVDDVSMFIPKVDEFWGLSPQVDGSSMFIPLDLMILISIPQSWWFINVYIL
jgi:hypothetical protein